MEAAGKSEGWHIKESMIPALRMVLRAARHGNLLSDDTMWPAAWRPLRALALRSVPLFLYVPDSCSHKRFPWLLQWRTIRWS